MSFVFDPQKIKMAAGLFTIAFTQKKCRAALVINKWPLRPPHPLLTCNGLGHMELCPHLPPCKTSIQLCRSLQLHWDHSFISFPILSFFPSLEHLHPLLVDFLLKNNIKAISFFQMFRETSYQITSFHIPVLRFSHAIFVHLWDMVTDLHWIGFHCFQWQIDLPGCCSTETLLTAVQFIRQMRSLQLELSHRNEQPSQQQERNLFKILCGAVRSTIYVFFLLKKHWIGGL